MKNLLLMLALIAVFAAVQSMPAGKSHKESVILAVQKKKKKKKKRFLRTWTFRTNYNGAPALAVAVDL